MRRLNLLNQIELRSGDLKSLRELHTGKEVYGLPELERMLMDTEEEQGKGEEKLLEMRKQEDALKKRVAKEIKSGLAYERL